MLNSLKQNIAEQNLFLANDKLLLAVSGGVDSMVLLHLFKQLNYKFSVAHCNFKLRGKESDTDEDFVRKYCEEHNVQLHVQQFETQSYAKANGISIEMAARDLRYEWFSSLLADTQSNYLLTAHHRDDAVETTLLNITRGTGVKGLMGIKAKANNIVRPLLFASRKCIESYAKTHKLFYRNDASNDDVIYQRNLIRHQIIPLFEQMNPAFKDNVQRMMQNLELVNNVYQKYLAELREQVCLNDKISISKLRSLKVDSKLLYELLTIYGFNISQVENIHKTLNAEAGRQFYSKTHRIIRDREYLLILPLRDEQPRSYSIEKNAKIMKPIALNCKLLEDSEGTVLLNDNNVAQLDADALSFPLTLRKWQQGDFFYPLGMKGRRKKLSDFFTDKKYSIAQKEAQWVLCSGEDIVWIVGERIDDRFKLKQTTNNICLLSFND